MRPATIVAALAMASSAFGQTTRPSAEKSTQPADARQLRTRQGAVAGRVAGRSAPEGVDAQISRLIRQLGRDRWQEREAATERLIEIGLPALGAVTRAMADPNLEVSMRAAYICRRVMKKVPAFVTTDRPEVGAMRLSAQLAFQKGRYEEMARLQGQLAGKDPPEPLDLIWLGHAHQLAGDWLQAAAAYKRAAKLIDGLPQVKGNLLPQRARLLRFAGLIQREQLEDPRAAAATFAEAEEALKQSRQPGRDIDTRCRLLQEAADSLEQAGDVAAALRSWEKVWRMTLDSPLMYRFRAAAVVRLLKKLPAGVEAPTPGVIVLSPQRPGKVLDLNDPKTARAASSYWQMSGTTIWSFTFSAPRGREIAALDVEADMEKGPRKNPAVVDCTADFLAPRRRRALVGRLFSTRDGPAKRELGKREFKVPAGADLVQLSTSCGRSHRVHRLTVAASFRPRQPADPWLMRRAYVLAEFQPAGGKGTCNGKPIDVRRGTYVAPGRCVFAYEHPGRKETFRYEAELPIGGRVGLFVNFESPFKQSLTDLRGIGGGGISASNSLVRLRDGRWLFAFDGPGDAIMLSRSRDMVEWEDPRPMPFSTVAVNTAPSLFLDAEGTAWLAWFSDRLAVSFSRSSERFSLWLSRSRDGREWTRPVPISLGRADPYPRDPVQMFLGPKNRYWMFWRGLAAAADSVGGITQLRPVSRPPAEQMRYVRIALDQRRRMNMVFNTKGQKGLFHSTSADGKRWSGPARLLGPHNGDRPWAGQLVLKGGRACLIYTLDNCGYACPAALGPKPKLGRSIKITNWHTRLNVTTAAVTEDDQAVLLVGTDAVWLLKASLKDLMGPRPSD